MSLTELSVEALRRHKQIEFIRLGTMVSSQSAAQFMTPTSRKSVDHLEIYGL